MDRLPFRADLGRLKRQAKDLLRAAEAGEAEAVARILAIAKASAGGLVVGPPVTLAAAQLAIAREHGFPSWARLKAAAERKEAEKTEAGWRREAVFGGWFDEEFQTDRETPYHDGTCRNCGASYEFETNIVRGFADFVEARCPRCSASLGEFREDVGVRIPVRLAGGQPR